MLRSAPRLLALLLTATALTGCGAMDFSSTPRDKDAVVKAKAPTALSVAGDLDGNLRKAKMLRDAGSYEDALLTLSQLVLIAPDDPRIMAEYGKALAQKGSAQDATQFLGRAIALSPNDWTLYSALGYSYDQLGDPANARIAYEHALVLKPGEPGVLSNYAVSRLLAKDPENARLLIAQAQAAGGNVPNAKISRNAELINGMAPRTDAEKPLADAVAAAKLPEPKTPVAVASAPKLPAPKIVAAAPSPAAQQPRLAIAEPQLPPIPVTPLPLPMPAPPAVAQNNAAPRNAGDVARLLANQAPAGDADGAPRQLAPQLAANEPPLPPAASEVAPGVVMQAVPFDPYAGPVTLKKPKPKPAVARAEPKTDAPQKDAKAETPKPTKTAAAAKPNVVPALRVAADKY